MQRSASNSVYSSGVRPDKVTCLKATGRPDIMETVANPPLPINTSFHSGLMSCVRHRRCRPQVAGKFRVRPVNFSPFYRRENIVSELTRSRFDFASTIRALLPCHRPHLRPTVRARTTIHIGSPTWLLLASDRNTRSSRSSPRRTRTRVQWRSLRQRAARKLRRPLSRRIRAPRCGRARALPGYAARKQLVAI